MLITIFTLALQDDNNISNNINSPLHSLCINSWNRVCNYITSLGYESRIRIYTENDAEVKKVFADLKIANPNITRIKKSHVADAFRLYILSQNKNYMWLDWDILINTNFSFNFNKMFLSASSFCLIYNQENLSIFDKMYKYYINNNTILLDDKAFMNKIIQEGIISNEYTQYRTKLELIHLYFLDNNDRECLYFIKDNDYVSEFVQTNKINKRNFRFINPNNITIDNVYGLQGNKEIINFLLFSFGLSSKQKNDLLSAISNTDGLLNYNN